MAQGRKSVSKVMDPVTGRDFAEIYSKIILNIKQKFCVISGDFSPQWNPLKRTKATTRQEL